MIFVMAMPFVTGLINDISGNTGVGRCNERVIAARCNDSSAGHMECGTARYRNRVIHLPLTGVKS